MFVDATEIDVFHGYQGASEDLWLSLWFVGCLWQREWGEHRVVGMFHGLVNKYLIFCYFVLKYIQWSAKSVYGVLDFSGTCAENILPVVCLKHGHGSIAKKGTCFGIRCEASWFSRFCRTSWKFTILPVLIHSSLQRRRKMKGDSQADNFPAFQVALDGSMLCGQTWRCSVWDMEYPVEPSTCT